MATTVQNPNVVIDIDEMFLNDFYLILSHIISSTVVVNIMKSELNT